MEQNNLTEVFGGLDNIDFNKYFAKIRKIYHQDIISSRASKRGDYNKGGFYMILNKRDGIVYIGKSVNYLFRIRQHLRPSVNKSVIDFLLKNENIKFEFYLLMDYKELGINYNNRKLEVIIEDRLITLAKEKFNGVYNIKHYGHL